MPAAVPAVEVADHADAIRVGRPDREVHAGRAADRHRVRAELVVDAGVLALAEQVEVEVGEHAAVAIRIVDSRRRRRRDTSPAADSRGSACRLRQRGFEDARGMPPRHVDGRRPGARDGDALGRSGCSARMTTPPGSTCGPSTLNGSAWRASASAWSIASRLIGAPSRSRPPPADVRIGGVGARSRPDRLRRREPRRCVVASSGRSPGPSIDVTPVA